MQELRVSPDGSRVVYRADGGSYGVFELYSAPADGSAAPVKLNDLLCDYGAVDVGFAISADGARVVYRADRDVNDQLELFSVPIDGSAAPLELSGPVLGDVASFFLSPDGARVAYLADQTVWHQVELYGAPLDGSESWQTLSGTLPGFASVAQARAAGAEVVYRADVVADNRYDLFSVPIDGSAAPLQLTHVPASNFVADVRVSPDGAQAVFTQRTTTTGLTSHLWSVPVDGSTAPVLLTPTPYAFVGSFAVATGGTRAVFTASATSGGPIELYTVPLDASAAPARLNPVFAAGRNVVQSALTADGARALYVADQAADELYEVWSAPVDASAAAVRLNGTLVSGGDVAGVYGVALVNASERVVYVADQDTDEVRELYSVPADGSDAVLKLSAVLSSASVHPYSLDPAFPTEPFGTDPSWVLFALDTQVGPETFTELYSVPVDGSANPQPVSGPLVSGGDVSLASGWAFAGDQALYVADQDTDETRDLYASPLDGSTTPIKLDGTLAPRPPEVLVEAPGITSDSQRVVYLFTQSGETKIYCGPPDGSSPPVALTGPVAYGNTSFQLSSDGAWVVYFTFPSGGPLELYSVPSDGSATPVLLFSGAMVAGTFTGPARITPTSDQVVFRANQQIVRVAIDGSSAPVYLTTAPVSQSRVILAFELASDGARVAFTQDRDTAAKVELYSVPLDGSSGPLKLNPVLPTNGDVGSFAISPDGAKVVYIADAAVDFQDELYAVPIAGGSAVHLNATPVSGGDVLSFSISPDGARVAYCGDQEVGFRRELYSVPITGGAVVKLNGPVVAGGGMSTVPDQFRFTPDSQRVLYIAVQDTPGTPELYSVLAGGGSRVKMNGPLVAGGTVTTPLLVSPDSRFVVFRADDQVENTFELFSRRVDGGGVSNRLNGPVLPEEIIGQYAITPDGRSVHYCAREASPYSTELYSVPIKGGERVRLNDPLVPRGDVAGFAITPDGKRVVYRADQEFEKVYELYSVKLEPAHAGKVRPTEGL